MFYLNQANTENNFFSAKSQDFQCDKPNSHLCVFLQLLTLQLQSKFVECSQNLQFGTLCTLADC